ncbi:MAG: hypothetical protein AB7Y46_00280 [Armatimonadota bacterium]
MTPGRAQLEARLCPYLLQRRLLGATVGLLQGLALAGVLSAALVLVAGRAAMLTPQIEVALALCLLLPVLARALQPVDPMAAALSIERSFPFLQDRVATAVDLTRRVPGRAGRSERIAERVLLEAAEALAELPLGRSLPLRTLRLSGLVALLGLELAALAWSAALPARPEARAPLAPTAPADERPVPRALPPVLTDLSLTVTPPPYTGLPTRRIVDLPETLRVPAASRIRVSARCSGREPAVSLATDAGGLVRLSVGEGGWVERSFTLTAPMRWRLEAEDGAGAAVSPWRRLEPVADAMPVVRLLRPEGDVTVDSLAPIEVAAAAADDYGIAALGLHYRRADEQAWHSLPLEHRGGSGSARLNLGAVGLRPDGEVILRAWATDTDAVTGPKTALSAPVRVRLLGAAGLSEEPEPPLEHSQREEQDALEELQRAAQRFGEELAEVLEQASAGGGQGGRAPIGRELQEAARRLEEQAGRLEAAMHEAERELSAREMITPELVEKVRELHELMREVLDQEMRQALEELQRALEAVDLDELRLSLEGAREAQQRFAQRLEQTLSLLRRARLEALIEQLRRRAEELAGRQQELGERTAGLPEGNTSEARRAQREQGELAGETEPLPDQIEATVEAAREVSAQMAARLGAIGDRLRRDDPAGLMRQAASALGRGSPSAAGTPQGEARRSLQRAASSLGELGRELAEEFSADARRQLAAMIRDALALSGGQEELTQDIGRLAEAGMRDLMRDKRAIDPMRRRQSTLADAASALAERMSELAGQTPAMDPALAAAMQAVAGEMAQTAREIEGADLGTATWRGRAAMAGLNEVARRLLQVEEQLASSSATSTLSDYIQRLQQLAQRQQGLNQQTGQAQAQRQQGQGAGESLAELALEQALIRQALQQMLEQGGRATQPMADQLGGVPEEMEQVEDELRAGRIERETVHRQERILEKMLEAQRSLYTREQEREERKAERPSAWQPPPSPPALSPSLLRAPALQVRPGAGAQALPRGYEELVREYFRALGEGSP